MNSKITHYLTITIICIIAERLVTYFAFSYLFPTVTGGMPVILHTGSWISIVTSNIGFAIWAYKESKNLVWTIAGVMFGLNALILYYLIKLNESK